MSNWYQLANLVRWVIAVIQLHRNSPSCHLQEAPHDFPTWHPVRGPSPICMTVRVEGQTLKTQPCLAWCRLIIGVVCSCMDLCNNMVCYLFLLPIVNIVMIITIIGYLVEFSTDWLLTVVIKIERYISDGSSCYIYAWRKSLKFIGIKRVRDPVTCRVFRIKYSKIVRAEYFYIKSATKSCDAWTLLEKYSSEYFYSSAGSKRRKCVIIRTASPIFINFIDFLLRQ